MKRSAILFALILLFLSTVGTASGQGCEFNIIGTWKAATTPAGDTVLYRFAPDGTVTVLSVSGSTPGAKPQEIARAGYKLDNAEKPKSIEFTATDKSRALAYGGSPMEITRYDDQSFTCVIKGSAPARWTRVDPNRHFIVLAARTGEFYDGSGSAFPILIKMVGSESQVDAVGTYSDHGTWAFGTVPPAAYKDFMREARADSEVMLRLEINPAQYERSLKIMRTWERRVREGAQLYPTGHPLNNVLLVKAVTETLTQCSDEIKLYKMNYIHPEDWLSDQHNPGWIPFAYFKELRRLNESRHVRDDKFQALLPAGTPQGN
jgi:hypothetical protein